MPVVGQRDPEQIKGTLEQWLSSKVGVDDVEITELVVPQSSGFSNETFLLSAKWTGVDEPQRLVLRSQPTQNLLFPEIDLIQQQYMSMKLLYGSDVPVAKVLWPEPDTSVLGQPFFVMERLDGQVPGDVPVYTSEGFVFDMTEEERARWNRNAVGVLAKIAKVDWEAAGFQHLDKQHHGKLGPEQRRNYFKHYLDWATKGEYHPIATPAYEKLVEMWPDDGEYIELCWGDARPGNQMFDGTELIAVFDWEMVSLGNAESDLGWWLFLQRFSSEGMGATLLPGMLDEAATIALWEELMGRKAVNVEFYKKLAGFHFTLVYLRITEVMGAPQAAFQSPVLIMTAEMLGLPHPSTYLTS